jgi:TolB-like protein/cytochrome c-type biogenesis protein CcmH/NrfG
MAFPLPDKPSIAVLPFINLSDDPEQELLSDGITENIITSLSRVPNLFVIARNSTFTYKGKPVKVQQVAEELGVRYVLEGSMQRSGDRVRINVQLIDALAGSHIWAQRYDREIKDVFALQDEISLKVAHALDVELVWGQGAEHYRSSVHNLEAYLTLMRARAIHYRHTKEDNFQSIQLYKKAIELDPEWIHPKIMLGYAYWVDARAGWNYPRQESFRRAGELAREALAADPSNSLAYNLLGALHLFPKREYEKAIEFGEKAVAMDPNNANAKSLLAFTLVFAGRPQEAIVLFKRAMRLMPYYPPWYAWILGLAYHLSGENEKAVEVTEKVRNQNPDSPFPHLILARVYADVDRMEKAQAAAAEVLRINPKFTVSNWAKASLFKDPAVEEHQAELMRRAGLPEHPPLRLPDKPSIAVLPFDNMSGDPRQEYFSDGITENIISSLSKVHNLFVIARNSTYTYKGKAVKIQQVAKELGVRYVLEGSVQKTADRVRISAQLIDAIKGNHLWAERYDRDLTDIFALQDEITKKIITSLQVKLTSGEDARLYGQTTDNLEAYLKFLEGSSHQMRLNKDDNFLARQKFKEAIALDANFIFALVNLAWTHTMDAAYGWAESRVKSLEAAEELAQKALSLDDSFGGTYGVLGSIQNVKGNVKESVALRKKAVALEPNSANYHALLGMTLIFMGDRIEEAINELKIANRLDPFPPNWILHYLGDAYRVKGEYEKAIAVFKKAIKNEPDYWLSYVSLSACYGLLGREEEARAAAAEVLRIDPKVSIAKVTIPFKDKADKERTIEVLKKAGLN